MLFHVNWANSFCEVGEVILCRCTLNTSLNNQAYGSNLMPEPYHIK